MYFFTADEHYGHNNIIRYCERPFENVYEMDNEIIARHNKVVGKNDVVIHAGDFTLKNKRDAKEYIKRLNGTHTFLCGSHDYWLRGTKANQILEKKINNQLIVVCHYAMRTWAASHYNSWHLYGHSHGKLAPIGKQHDVGVDNNDFYPVSFDKICSIMESREDNPNLVKK